MTGSQGLDHAGTSGAREQSDAAALRDGAAEDVEDVGARGDLRRSAARAKRGKWWMGSMRPRAAPCGECLVTLR